MVFITPKIRYLNLDFLSHQHQQHKNIVSVDKDRDETENEGRYQGQKINEDKKKGIVLSCALLLVFSGLKTGVG